MATKKSAPIKVKEVIENILTEKKYTRDSDELLYYYVCMTFNPNIKKVTFEDLFKNRTYFGVPTYETVRRSRAKLQRENKKLEYTNKELINSIEVLNTELNNAYDCDCGWYEDFYYEHSAEVGAYE